MKLMKLIINKYTYLWWFILYALNIYKPFLIVFLIIFIHELSHCFVAKILNIKVYNITIYSIGCVASIENFDNLSIIKKCCIYIAGPLSHLFMVLLLIILTKINILSVSMYDYARMMNYNYFVFNLLPMYPLDGFNILKTIMHDLLKCRLSFIYTISIIVVIIIFSTFFEMTYATILVMVLLLFCNIKKIRNIKYDKTNLELVKKYKV